jgi:two-component system, LytTR family, sensor kinase
MKELLDKKRFKPYGWVGLLIVCMCTIQESHGHVRTPLGQAFLDCVWLTIWLTLVSYILYEYRVPRLRWRRFYIAILLLPWYLFLFTEGFHLWAKLGYALHINKDYIDPPGTRHDLTEEASFSIPAAIMYGIGGLIYKHLQLRQKTQQLQIEKQTAELNYLKSQTNPHFLFNTLNNIYSLARDKSDLAPESILRLSKILRYMLYETSGPFIAIEEELKIINDYIALEKLRYDDTLRVNFNYDIEDPKQSLPPLILIPLVENAFKHGAAETRDRPFIDIHLSVNRRQLAFIVRNSTERSDGDGRIKENIGLSNLRRQLELLYTEYNISLEQRESEFSAALTINLASHV